MANAHSLSFLFPPVFPLPSPFAPSPPWSQARPGTGDLDVCWPSATLTPIQGGVAGVGGTPGPVDRGPWTSVDRGTRLQAEGGMDSLH
jgi:hypothetical protein